MDDFILVDSDRNFESAATVSLNEWLKIKNNYGLEAALQYFPNDFPRSGFTFNLYGIEEKTLKQEADQCRSDFIKIMEFRKNPEYGKWKCFRGRLSTDREEAGIFIGINKVQYLIAFKKIEYRNSMPTYLLIPNIQIPNVHFRGCSSLCHYIIVCLTCSIWKGNSLSQTASLLSC